MRSTSWLLAIVLLSAAFQSPHAATLFREDFQTIPSQDGGEPVRRCQGPGGAGTYPFPDDWLLRNVDNHTPSPSVGYVNDAWEVREDFASDPSNCVAFSTSWYTPAGAADDWMWTPLIGPLPTDGGLRLSWRARAMDPAFADGYEVRVMTESAGPPSGGSGDMGNQLSNSELVFSIPAESSTWTTRTVELDAFAGQSIYIAFRNATNDRFLLTVDDVHLEHVPEFDPRLLGLEVRPALEYARVPAWFGSAHDLEAGVGNVGIQPLTGVAVVAEVLVDGFGIASLASAPVDLAPDTESTVQLGEVMLSAPGHWSLLAAAMSDQGDEEPDDPVMGMDLATVTTDSIGRAEGDATGTIGIGAGNGGELGTDFSLPLDGVLRAVRLSISNGDDHPPGAEDGIPDFNGVALEVVVRDWNPVDDTPGELVASSSVTVPADAALGTLALEFPFDDLELPAGRYLVALREPADPEPLMLTLQTHDQRFTPGTNWATWPTVPGGGWANMEDFGSGFARALAITAVVRASVPVPIAMDDAFVVAPHAVLSGSVAANDTPSDHGGNHWSVTVAPASGTLSMQPDGAITYTPDPAAAGSTVSFGYGLCDVDDHCDSAVAEISILPYRIFRGGFESE